MKKLVTILIFFFLCGIGSQTFARDKETKIKILTSPYYLAAGYVSLAVEYPFSESIHIGLDYLSNDEYYFTNSVTVIRPYFRYYGTPDEKNSLFIGAGYMIKNSTYDDGSSFVDSPYESGSSVVLESGYSITGGMLTFDIGFESAISSTLPQGKTTDLLLRFGIIW